MAKILIVEDDTELSGLIADKLASEHHLTEEVHDGKEADELLKFYEYELVILDWDLPGMKGVDILKEYRDRGGNTPVIMLTGHDSVDDKEKGLDTGADDYLTKPFSMVELNARVRALLRRPTGYTETTLKVKDLELDPVAFTVSRKGEPIKLLPKEFALLEFLVRHKNQVFTAEAILDRVWSSESDATGETLRTCLKRLRQRIDRDGEPSVITTIRGLGYKVEDN